MPLKVYDGTKWVIAANVKIWDGTSWVNTSNNKVWDGSDWVKYHPGVYLINTYVLTSYAIGIGSSCTGRVQAFANGHIQGITTSTNFGTTIVNDDIWKLSGDTSDYDFRITNLVGSSGVSGSMSGNVAYSSSTNPYFEIQAVLGYDTYCNFNLQILANNTGTVLSNTNVDITASVIDLG
jgi:hypothetical protein